MRQARVGVNNFWKALAVQPDLLRRTWEGVKDVMTSGVLDPLTKEMIYIAVSTANGCTYCINSHTAAARLKGMTDEMVSELMAIIGMAILMKLDYGILLYQKKLLLFIVNI